MSTYKTFQTKGVRSFSSYGGFSVSCPNVAKYVTPVGYWLTSDMMSQATFSTTASAYDEENKGLDAIGTAEYILTGTTAAALSGTAFVIKGGKLKYVLRNNDSSVATVTMFKCKPRKEIGDQTDMGVAATSGTIWASFLAEGLADKLATVQTAGDVMIHSVAPSSGAAVPVGSLPWGVAGTQHEVSFIPTLTIYDSSLFCSNFLVVEQYTIVLKPGDEAFVEFDLNGQEFLDGLEPYNAMGLTYHEFSRLFLCQVHGHLGHESTYGVTGLQSADADPTSFRKAARKQSSAVVMPKAVHVDLWWESEFMVEIFDAELIQPATAQFTMSTANADDYADALNQTTHDLQA